jgi:hypothetical protein
MGDHKGRPYRKTGGEILNLLTLDAERSVHHVVLGVYVDYGFANSFDYAIRRAAFYKKAA